ncbi:universal stress protein [Cypionkella psychrotolerans]|uniref:universal stress protein n=1 Tax=Cypionkella psychrotolerans TaxID=1678131 RepID=UPI0006B4AD65|nr:universal stress protein [Cypionkella psychrotolerans]
MKIHTAYMPLNTYPDAVSDDAVRAAVGFAASLGAALHVTTFAVNIPQMRSPLGGLVLDVPGMVRVAEERSRAECLRLGGVVREAGPAIVLDLDQREVVLGAALDAAADEARYYDLSVLPWSGDSIAAQDMTQAVVFGSGRPTIVVPPSAREETLHHLAVAWDGSRVAARALWDAVALLPEGGRITVLTVQDEKLLAGQGIAQSLALSLRKRGFAAEVHEIAMGSRTIGETLQEAALDAGASLLAMGGFGHSRIRDFILGGATKGVFSDLRLPVLMSH